jgi:AmiR/NasT family two-component response regulator
MWRDSAHNRREIHQATGIIVNQLAVPVGAAYARLSGHAFATSTTMAAVAHDVVTRGLLPQVAN